MKILGMPQEGRTFETRLQFINSIFANKFLQQEIMSSSVQYKLRQSFESFNDELNASIHILELKDPIKVLRAKNK